MDELGKRAFSDEYLSDKMSFHLQQLLVKSTNFDSHIFSFVNGHNLHATNFLGIFPTYFCLDL